jgi:hypothetical protein
MTRISALSSIDSEGRQVDIPAQLEAVDRKTLSHPVRRMLSSDTVEVLDWQFHPLRGGSGNPVSAGLYRFAGSGQDHGKIMPWSLVLKIAQSPANVGATDAGEGQDRTHWNYWKREMYVYHSTLLDSLPAGLAAPRCFGVEERPGNVIWLWLEEISDIYDQGWPLERYGLAARHFGCFNGAYLAGRPLPGYPWLGVGLFRHWYTNLPVAMPLLARFRQEVSTWEDPTIRRIFPRPEKNPFVRLLIEWEPFVNALDQLPQTVCHRDAYPTNLMARRSEDGGEETVAVDWALTGIGPVGEELAQLAFGAFHELEGIEPGDVNQVVFGGYLRGLRESGWRGDVSVVRFGFVTSTVLRAGLTWLWSLCQGLQKSRSDEPNETEQELVKVANERRARRLGFMLGLAEEAYGLLNVIA